MLSQDDKRMAVSAIEKEYESRTKARSNSKEHSQNITPSEVMIVRVKSEFIRDIGAYWTSDFTEWFPPGRKNLQNPFDADVELLCGFALIAQVSSLGSINRLTEVKTLLGEQIEQRLKDEAFVQGVDVFCVLEKLKHDLFDGHEIDTAFYETLPHRRSFTEAKIQDILENAAECRGSAHGTPELGVTVMDASYAREGAKSKMSEGAFWKIPFSRSSMVAIWTEERTKTNIECIRLLEEHYGQPLAVILKAPELRAREALAMPTDLLQKILTFSQQFVPSISQLHQLLSRKLLEKQEEICELMDTTFRSLRAADVEEIIQETLRGRISPSPSLDSLFEGSIEDATQENLEDASEEPLAAGIHDMAARRPRDDEQSQLEGRPQKRVRLSSDEKHHERQKLELQEPSTLFVSAANGTSTIADARPRFGPPKKTRGEGLQRQAPQNEELPDTQSRQEEGEATKTSHELEDILQQLCFGQGHLDSREQLLKQAHRLMEVQRELNERGQALKKQQLALEKFRDELALAQHHRDV